VKQLCMMLRTLKTRHYTFRYNPIVLIKSIMFWGLTFVNKSCNDAELKYWTRCELKWVQSIRMCCTVRSTWQWVQWGGCSFFNTKECLKCVCPTRSLCISLSSRRGKLYIGRVWIRGWMPWSLLWTSVSHDCCQRLST